MRFRVVLGPWWHTFFWIWAVWDCDTPHMFLVLGRLCLWGRKISLIQVLLRFYWHTYFWILAVWYSDDTQFWGIGWFSYLFDSKLWVFGWSRTFVTHGKFSDSNSLWCWSLGLGLNKKNPISFLLFSIICLFYFLNRINFRTIRRPLHPSQMVNLLFC